MSLYRQAVCPVCGTAHGVEITEAVRGKKYIKLARRNYWERTKDFDPDKPFGVIQEAAGRGSFKLVGYFSPEEDVNGFFPLIKARLLQALKEWRDKDWISEEEIKEVLK